jgi:hypothetical protein
MGIGTRNESRSCAPMTSCGHFTGSWRVQVLTGVTVSGGCFLRRPFSTAGALRGAASNGEDDVGDTGSGMYCHDLNISPHDSTYLTLRPTVFKPRF